MTLADITSAKVALVLTGHRVHKLNKKTYKADNPADIMEADWDFYNAKVIDSGTRNVDEAEIAFGNDWDCLLESVELFGTNDQWDSMTSSTSYDWFLLQDGDWRRYMVVVPADWK